MIKLYGLLDLITAVVLVILRFFNLKVIGWIVVGYLVVKAFIYIKSWASVIDLIGAVFVILAIFGQYYMVTWIFVIWFLQKAFVSLTA